MRPRTVMLSVGLTISLASVLASCQTGRTYSNPDTSRIQQLPVPLEKTSEGIKADYRIAQELNRIPGLQGSAVLIKDGKAFVGTHVIGPETTPDVYMQKQDYGTGDRSRYSGKGIPQNPSNAPETSQNGVTQSGQSMPEYMRQAGRTARPGRAPTATGNMNPELKQQIESKVKSMAPGVTHVYIVSNAEKVAQLQGYARFIQDGGSIAKFKQDFDETMKQIWPESGR